MGIQRGLSKTTLSLLKTSTSRPQIMQKSTQTSASRHQLLLVASQVEKCEQERNKASSKGTRCRHELCSEMRLTKLKRKTNKALAASASGNYDQKRKGNKVNTCVGNFLQFPFCTNRLLFFAARYMVISLIVSFFLYNSIIAFYSN